ncbi:MAG TPA: DUF1634 domain-containing protein [Candidatus Saccharimonadales bacterium]|jgi:uncharacterized membrane protein|nr:DUF1634 domain-containing protein [Candidatus Saccharimonadales bacterium]
MKKDAPFTDLRLELMIGNLLRWGVALAAAVVLAGGILYLIQHGAEHADYHDFHGPNGQSNSVSGVLHEAATLHSRGIIQLGLLLLVLTPIARVILSAIGFIMERDWMYLTMTLIVLTVLLYSLMRIP